MCPFLEAQSYLVSGGREREEDDRTENAKVGNEDTGLQEGSADLQGEHTNTKSVEARVLTTVDFKNCMTGLLAWKEKGPCRFYNTYVHNERKQFPAIWN